MPAWGKGFWKFNNSLTSNDDYVEKMKNQISETIRMLDPDKIIDKHLRWEFLNYKIRKFTINISKKLVKEENKDRNFLEKELKNWKKTYKIFEQMSAILDVNKNFKIYIPRN